MFYATAPALEVERIEVDGEDVVITSDWDRQLVAIATNASDLKAALATRRSSIIVNYSLEDGPSETTDCSYVDGVLHTPVGTIAMNITALSVWLEFARPGDYWERPQLAIA